MFVISLFQKSLRLLFGRGLRFQACVEWLSDPEIKHCQWKIGSSVDKVMQQANSAIGLKTAAVVERDLLVSGDLNQIILFNPASSWCFTEVKKV